MPRKKTFRTSDFPYHVTGRSANQEWFHLPMPEMWEIFSNYLWFVAEAYKIRIHAFVLMRNHFHLLLATPESNIDSAMNYFLREVSKEVGRRTGRINQLFGGPYHWSVIKNPVYYHHAYKYVYRNPVEAGACVRVQDYPYSTIRGLLGMDRTIIPAVDNMCLIQDVGKQLKWLNEGTTPEHLSMVRRALRKTEFELPRDKTGRRRPMMQLQKITIDWVSF